MTVVSAVLFFVPDKSGELVTFAIALAILTASLDAAFVCAMVKTKGMALLAELTVKAAVTAKNVVQKEVSNGDSYEIRNYCKLTFETETHIQWTFDSSVELYNALLEGDYGTLVYKESKKNKIYYVGFLRER